MSFARVGRPQQHNKGKRPIRLKKAASTKREWVSTVNDLSVHKLTPAELSHRHEIHKSHNQAAAQWELKEKALKSRLRHGGSPVHLDRASLSIIREVFSDQLLLQDVLARSDRAMAVVKDIFGDTPRRQTGHPSVTVAPHYDCDSELPVHQRPDPPTKLSLLTQSMMDQEALNEVDVDDAHPSDSPDCHVVRSRVNARKIKRGSRDRNPQRQKVQHSNCHGGDSDDVTVTPLSSRIPDRAALNATVAVQRIRNKNGKSENSNDEISSLVSQVLNPEPLNQKGKISSHRARKDFSRSSVLDASSAASAGSDQSSLGLLQALLGQVEADLDSLIPDTSAPSSKHHRTQGLTGFSMALVSTLARLVHLLKQREDESRKEVEERGRLQQDLSEQRGLIDALTAETMTLRDEAASLRAALQQQTSELERKVDWMVLVMGELRLLGERKSASEVCDVREAGPLCRCPHVAEPVNKQPQVLQVSAPCPRDKWQNNPVTNLGQQQLPPLPRQHHSGDTHSSAPSFSSLQPTKLPSASSLSSSSDPLRTQPSTETMLAEIMQLNRQNDMIKAELRRARGIGSDAGGSISSVAQQRSRANSTGKVTPQVAGVARRPVSSEEEPLMAQARTCTLAVDMVEQRLQELNRQSATARGRLLQLIEQQKQSVSVSVSPSASPIHPSAFSPNPPERSVEALSLLPEREVQSDSRDVDRRSAASQFSSPSFEGQKREGKAQMHTQRQQEGWFALSAHVK